MPRAGKIAVVTLASVYLAYLVLGNLFLGTKLLARLVSLDPETVTLDYESAHTFWPGHAHVEGFHVHGSDSVLEWMIEIDEADVEVDLWALFDQTFRATRVRAKGYAFRVRLRIDAADAEGAEARALPSIRGYGSPPMPRAGPPEAPITDDAYDLWTADLEDVDATIREIWIQQHRYAGGGRVSGGFYFKPLRAVEIRPSVIELADGELTVGEHVVARPEARVVVSSRRFDPRDVTGIDALQWMTLQLSLEAQVPSLDFLQLYGVPSGGVALSGGGGEVRAELGMREGLLAPSSAVSYATSHVTVTTGSLALRTGGELRLVTADAPAAPRARLSARMPSIAVGRPGTGIAEARAEDVWAVIDTAPLDVARLPSTFRAEAYVPAAVIEDLRILSPGKPTGDAPGIEGGAAFLKARIKLDEAGRASGYLSSLVKRAALRWKQTSLVADAAIKLPFEGGAGQAVVKGGTVALTGVAMAYQRRTWPGWWANIDIAKAQIGPDHIAASIVAKCRDAMPAVRILDAEDIIPAWALGLFTMEGLVIVADVDRTERRLRVDLRRAEGGALDITGRLDIPVGNEPKGAFIVSSGILSAGIAIKPDGPTISPLAGKDWLAERLAALGK